MIGPATIAAYQSQNIDVRSTPECERLRARVEALETEFEQLITELHMLAERAERYRLGHRTP